MEGREKEEGGEKERREGEERRRGERSLHQRASREPTLLPPSSQPHPAAEAPTRKGLVSSTEV
jgi:hypothetical protein